MGRKKPVEAGSLFLEVLKEEEKLVYKKIEKLFEQKILRMSCNVENKQLFIHRSHFLLHDLHIRDI